METICIIFLIIFGFSGWAYALWVNESWFKDSVETTMSWHRLCTDLNNDWGNRCIELAKRVDELEAERRKNENQ